MADVGVVVVGAVIGVLEGDRRVCWALRAWPTLYLNRCMQRVGWNDVLDAARRMSMALGALDARL